MRGLEEWLIALNVDVDVCVHLLGHSEQTIGAGREFWRRFDDGDAAFVAEIDDLGGVRSHDNAREAIATQSGSVDPDQQRLPCKGAHHFTGQARGGQPGRNDGENAFGHLGLQLHAPGFAEIQDRRDDHDQENDRKHRSDSVEAVEIGSQRTESSG